MFYIYILKKGHFVGQTDATPKGKYGESEIEESLESEVADGTLAEKKLNDDIRFSSKIRFPGDVYTANYDLINSLFPLGPDNYPLDKPLYDLLSQSYCVSTVLSNGYEVTQDIATHVALAGAPNHAPAPDFWDDFEEVVDTQITRIANSEKCLHDIFPTFPRSQLWEGFTVNEAAEAVHDEYPG